MKVRPATCPVGGRIGGRMRRVWAGCVFLLGTAGVLTTWAAELRVDAAEALRAPDQGWLEGVWAEEADWTWQQVETAAVEAALVAADRNRSAAMEGWLLVARWARLLATDQRTITHRWIEAVNTAQLGHPNMRTHYDPPAEPLSQRLRVEFVTAMVMDTELSSSFFQLLTPYDHLPGVLSILDRLHREAPGDFEAYAQLALAIALVFDVPPPPGWPHGQVGPEQLPRILGDPLTAFRYWVAVDRAGGTWHDLRALGASELKFVVDAAAPEAELNWVRESLPVTFANLPDTYDAVAYRQDRVQAGAYVWPGRSYALPVVLRTGGICVDQGYFAAQVGKARGVPTLLFRGVGLDGRHAWFGYLDAQQHWQMDVGRYAEQKLVSGVAFDPQTWGDVNDHELAFLAERFHRLPRTRQSRAWGYLAQELIRRDDAAAAVKAAHKATGLAPRNLTAWEVRVIAEAAAGWSAVKREATLREAARALQRYPDLYARFMRAAILVMRERGQLSAAAHEERMLARKFKTDRSDIAIGQAAAMLNRTRMEDDPATQLRVFESALRQFGVEAGMDAFDRLVRPFFEHARREGRDDDALAILHITTRLIPIGSDTQFATEMKALAASLR